MKNLILIIAAAFAATAHAQIISDDKVPAAVSSAFKAKFPEAEKAKWEMENAKDYEVTFIINKGEQAAVFDANGNWLETEIEIKVSELPQAVSQAIAKQFSAYKIKEAERVEKKEGSISFEVELAKGKEILEVVFSRAGGVLEKKTAGKKDKEDKD